MRSGPALLACRRASAAGVSEEPVHAFGGDTFVLRASSADVRLQAPLLREQPAKGRYSGYLFVAEGGHYSLELYWLNSRYAGWYDVNGGHAADGHAADGHAADWHAADLVALKL